MEGLLYEYIDVFHYSYLFFNIERVLIFFFLKNVTFFATLIFIQYKLVTNKIKNTV